jgi:sigma-B regulation protein RsbU (phosphoserine phosphatase)
MARLNDALLSQNLSHATFATAIYGYINTATQTVCFARGGHPNPVLLKRQGEVRQLESEGALLGIFPDEPFTDCRVQMEAGDRLLLFTDGVEVAFSETEQVDPTQWLGELEARKTLPAEALLQSFAERIDANSGSLAPKDDLTMIAIEAA